MFIKQVNKTNEMEINFKGKRALVTGGGRGINLLYIILLYYITCTGYSPPGGYRSINQLTCNKQPAFIFCNMHFIIDLVYSIYLAITGPPSVHQLAGCFRTLDCSYVITRGCPLPSRKCI